MFSKTKAFSGFSVKDIDAAKDFYHHKLGIEVEELGNGLLTLHLYGGTSIVVYPKDNHEPATFTILNFPVKDIDQAVEELTNAGIKFEQYTGDMATDEKGILRSPDKNMGPDIAWFKDPSGNILSVLEDKEM